MEALSDQFYGWLEEEVTVDNARELLLGLMDYVTAQGPFDGIIGFSEGGLVAASLLVEDARHKFAGFKCGIFFSAPPPPLDPEVTRADVLRCLEPAKDGVLIHVPTAHIRETNGLDELRCKSPLNPLWQRVEEVASGDDGLAQLCDADLREVFLHELGHQIPGSRPGEELSGALRAIERTMQKARALST